MYTYRTAFAKKLIVSSLAGILCIVFFFIIGGLDADELRELLRFIIPIKSAYLIASVKYLSQLSKGELMDHQSTDYTLRYHSIANWIIYVHSAMFVIFTGLISINRIDFVFYMDMLAILETFLGGVIGFLVADILGVKKEK